MSESVPRGNRSAEELRLKIRGLWMSHMPSPGQPTEADLDAALRAERLAVVEEISTAASDLIETGVGPIDAFHRAMHQVEA